MKSNQQQSALLKSGGVIDFCCDVCNKDSVPYIVAIARKMPRLLEFAGLLGSTTSTIVTDRALPWLTDLPRGRRLRIVDDVMNVGTTIEHHLSYARREFPDLQADVRVFARRKSNVAQHRWIENKQDPFQFRIDTVFEDETYREFETALPLELLKLGKPYDIDFPILNIPISSDKDLAKTPEEWLDIFAARFPSVHNLTVPSQRSAGITSITVIDPLVLCIEDILLGAPQELLPPPKVRLYISRDERTLRMAPMWIPGILEKFLATPSPLLKGALGQLFQKLSPKAKKGDPFEWEPQYNLLIYLISFAYGWYFLPHISALLPHGITAEPYLNRSDLALLFGDTVAEELFTTLSKLLCQSIPSTIVRSQLPAYPCPRHPINVESSNIVLKKLTEQEYSGAGLQIVFRECMRTLDAHFHGDATPDPGTHPDYRRLRHGLSLYDIWWLASKVCKRESPRLEELSFLLDFYIDTGAVVPVIEKVDGLYIRTYRRGEADPIEFAHFVHSLLLKHNSIFPNSPLRVTEFTKILSALAIYHPDKTPLVPVFEFRGSVPFFRSEDAISKQLDEALDFLQRKSFIRLVAKAEATQQLSFGLE